MSIDQPGPDSAVAEAVYAPLGQGVGELTLSGPWQISSKLPMSETLIKELGAGTDIKKLKVLGTDVANWDSSLTAYLTRVISHCRSRKIEIDLTGLSREIQELLDLAFAVPERQGARRVKAPHRFLDQLGKDVLDLAESTGQILDFIGDVLIAFRALLRGKANFRRSDLWAIVQQTGPDALPIISLVTFLVGLILAYIGEQQLGRFGAKLYVADLVGLAMVIQIGALITAIVLAGRTGAAFAAQLGTMQVNEELDALKGFGMAPMEFLVLPRMLALMLVTPMLALYADLMGILGGAFVTAVVGELTLIEYFIETRNAIEISHVAQGIFNACIYGAIVAISGCLRGMQCGRSASSVGQAATSAVVTAIVFIVIAAAVLTIVYNALGI
jgi:phospholipid/cholesterol/gamma-HCH transport system permease protein